MTPQRFGAHDYPAYAPAQDTPEMMALRQEVEDRQRHRRENWFPDMRSGSAPSRHNAEYITLCEVCRRVVIAVIDGHHMAKDIHEVTGLSKTSVAARLANAWKMKVVDKLGKKYYPNHLSAVYVETYKDARWCVLPDTHSDVMRWIGKNGPISAAIVPQMVPSVKSAGASGLLSVLKGIGLLHMGDRLPGQTGRQYRLTERGKEWIAHHG